jgi:flagellar hook-basal body complex protein FliE
MPTPILPVTHTIAIPALPSKSASAGGSPFQSVFAEAVKKVELFQHNAQQSTDRFLNGEGEEIHKVALAAQQADLSFQMFLQVRNKVISAYQEIMRMQI